MQVRLIDLFCGWTASFRLSDKANLRIWLPFYHPEMKQRRRAKPTWTISSSAFKWRVAAGWLFYEVGLAYYFWPYFLYGDCILWCIYITNLYVYVYIYISGGPLSALTCCVNVRLLSAIKKISPLIYSQSWVGSWVYTTQAMMTFTLIV